ncbi:hypothetical protein LRP67_09160 [Nocardioides sp. cx-169]|uniref:hypothetical protein n=1 Tax=Nocardioides sp. cx-169 TaxID=2899080 RepID=UPI001E2C02A5|nr:hypothetical protein [Nocardioides sp. cx-169]MCD4534247.1 hypothetical protein [Nocardioides sp. cx-169]
MLVRARLCRILRTPGGNIVASDAVGRIHLLDSDLQVLLSSPVNRSTTPFYALLLSGDWVVGRDKLGNIARWDARTLEMTHWLETRSTSDEAFLWEDEEPSLTISRGIVELDGKVYVNNGFMQLVVLDLESFSVVDVRSSPSGDTPIEWMCVDLPDVHAVTDKHGNLYLGDLRTNSFPTTLSLDEDANLHRVRYDRLHHRFWVIQDEGSGETALISNGVVTVSPDGRVDQEERFALDDIECLEISEDGTRVYAAGFDGVIEEFDNTGPVLRRARSIGPFSHQVSDLALADDGCIYVLCQNGVLTKIDNAGRVVAKLDFTPQCMWDVDHVTTGTDEHAVLHFASDHGIVSVVPASSKVGPPTFSIVSTVQTGLGFSRRIRSFADGDGVVIGRSGTVARYGDAGVTWAHAIGGIVHDLSVSTEEDRVAVAANCGAFELRTADGEQLARHGLDGSPVWACSYLAGGELVLSTRAGRSVILTQDRQVRLRFEIGDFPKRMWQQSERTLTVTGGGGIRQFDLATGELIGHFKESLSNTAENAIFHHGFVYVVTYDSQLAVFREEGEFLGVIEGVLPDFPKALTILPNPSGADHLVVGGRGGYLSTFHLLEDGTPVPSSTTWLRDAGAPLPESYPVKHHGS